MTESKEAKPNNCANCKFFRRVNPGAGDCHRSPPHVEVEAKSSSRHLNNKTLWPVVSPGDWCGEFVARQTPTCSRCGTVDENTADGSPLCHECSEYANHEDAEV